MISSLGTPHHSIADNMLSSRPIVVQCTKLIATAGVTVSAVLRPAGITRTPTSTPRLRFKLYSIAGARPNAWLAPESSWTAVGFCALLESRMLVPVTRVFAP